MPGNCATCWYWSKSSTADNDPNATVAECRINPPTHAGFPKTKHDAWCGKFETSAFMPKHPPSGFARRAYG